MSDIGRWLEQQDLGEYAELFEEERVELETLPDLTEQDLKDLGLPLGSRKKLLRALKSLGDDEPPTEDKGSGSIERHQLESRPGEAERRQLTVMFCDLVGSTALSESLDPEVYRELLTAYQDAARAAISPLEGYIARYMGDGLLVYFGYPRAHEDDAERAVLASLAIVAAVEGLDLRDGTSLAVRIGIATGIVVAGDIVGEGASEERAVLGETPNLAARLQGIALPNSVVIAATTADLVSGRFLLDSLGLQTLRGLSAPVPAFRVIGPEETESRFAASARGPLRPMVGRDDELAMVIRRWERATAGEAQLVLIAGEPGIGKSRLIQAIRDKLAGEAHIPLLYQCSPFFQNSSLRPIVEQMRRMAHIGAEETDAVALQRLEGLLRRSSRFIQRDVPLFASLLGISCDQPPALADAEERRKATIVGLLRYLEGWTGEAPVLGIFEDVHWADPSTLELLDRMVTEVTKGQILLVLSYRPEFECPWLGRSQSTSLTLSRISALETAALASNVADEVDLPEPLLARIVERTDGIPLFVEELTRAVLESSAYRQDSDGLAEATIPSSLHDSLMERLDRLGEAKEIAQAGAVIGREFEPAQVSAVGDVTAGAVTAGLDALMKARLVLQHHDGRNQRFAFKHALVQDAAYQSLLQSRRRILHKRAAQMFGEQLAPAEIIAHHHEAAGNPAEALPYWREAARTASQQGAHTEALEYLGRAVRLIDELPADGARDGVECDLYLEQAGSMRVVERLDEAFDALDRAEVLASEHDDSLRLSSVCFLRGNLYFPLGNLDGCLEQHELSRRHARSAGDVEREARALSGLGDAYYLRGQMITAHDHFNRCVTLSEANALPDIALANRSMRGATGCYKLDLQGAIEDALASADTAKETNQLRPELVARGVLGNMFLEAGRTQDAAQQLQRALVVADTLGALRFRPQGLMWLSRVKTLEGDRRGAIALLEEAYRICEQTGVKFLGPAVLGILAVTTDEQTTRRRALEDGLRILDLGCVSHNYLVFYRNAMEAALLDRAWNEDDRYAARLEDYTKVEPLPWTDFFIAHGRALAALGRDVSDGDALQELKRLYEVARKAGFVAVSSNLESVIN